MRNNTGRSYVPFTQLPPVVTSSVTLQYHNQDTDNDTVKIENISAPPGILHAGLL